MKIARKDVEPGDWAHHKNGYDARQVTRINTRSVYLELFGNEIGPCPADNYTYTRPEDISRVHARA